MTALLILLLLTPVFFALLSLVIGKEILNFTMVIGILIILLLTFWTLMEAYNYFPKGIINYIGSYPWLSPDREPVNVVGFLIDPLSAILLIIVTLMGFFVILFSTEYMSKRNVEHPTEEGNSRYYFWMMIFIGSMIGVSISSNFLMLFWFWEITTLVLGSSFPIIEAAKNL